MNSSQTMFTLMLLIVLFVSGCSGNTNQNKMKVINETELQQYGYLLEGNKDAKVRIYVFSDYLCPYCAKFANETKDLFEEYTKEGKIAVYYVDFIIHKDSIPFALAARCSVEQNKQKEFHYEMFKQIENRMNNNQAISQSLIVDVAQKLGMDSKKLTDCVNSKKYLDSLYNSTIMSKNLGLLGTPSLAINNQFVLTTYDKSTIKNEIDKRLTR
ncbi:MAG: DsbA family protein [Candidatus Micrarchaeota archaeon]|nr:DsbA family protein [Candidatus Micrarchaeota archaeon]